MSAPAIAGIFKGKHIVSTKQFKRTDIEQLLLESEAMRKMVLTVGANDVLKGLIVAELFYEPSTRTFASFVAAAQRLGAGTIPIQGVEYSSVAKGETLTDTVRSLESYADIVVLRHPVKGSVAKAAAKASKPLINAGDGVGEHPTQALLDLFTIKEELGHLDGLTVTMVGDLKNGRTVHSLARLLALFGATCHYVSPDSLRMPPGLMREFSKLGLKQFEHRSLDTVLPKTDVLYVTRVQKERFETQKAYQAVKGIYVITPAIMKQTKKRMVVMHPLPRVDEISQAVDKDPRAAYFRQMEYGMYVRMALLAMVAGKSLVSETGKGRTIGVPVARGFVAG